MKELKKGQPPKILKDGVQERFIQAISRGATYNLAAGYAGITYKTYREWIKRAESMFSLSEEDIDEHPDKVYYNFHCLVKRTESLAALKWLEKIDDASLSHWQAAAWKLERRYPKEYGRVFMDKEKKADDNSVEKAKDEVKKLKNSHG